jgi:hypothetical protein
MPLLALRCYKMRKHNPGPIYAIRLQARPGADGIRALRATLKALWRHHHVRCLDAREVNEEKRPPSNAVKGRRGYAA